MKILKKVILFDLYDTVLKDVSFDFSKGIKYLYDNFFGEKCSLTDIIDYAETFLPLYDRRKIDYSEVCLIRDEVPHFFDKFDVLKPEVLDELEYAIMNHMQNVTLLEDVRYTLNELQKLDIKMYILSNSIFTGSATRRLLSDFGILHYFEKVFSSADYKVRKPSKEFYQLAITEILSVNHGVEKDEILYVGNDYITDVIGATSVGLKTVWYNVNHLPNQKRLNIFEIDSFRQLLSITQR